MPLIDCEKVDVFYGDFQALEQITCQLEPGAIGLLGPNGAGKSTFLKTILGFNRPTSGTLSVLGLEMPAKTLQVRCLIGYMPEREITSPKVSAVSFLTYCGRLLGMTRVDAMERTHEVLNYVGLGESRYRKMETFSTGMLQRVKLAQALIHDPKLLLLDEPTNGLDPEGRLDMLHLIHDIAHKREVSVILSSHLLPDVQHVCNQVIIINGGKVVESGPMESLTAHRDNTFEIRLHQNREQFVAALNELGANVHANGTGTILVECTDTLPQKKLFELAIAHDTQIRHLKPSRRSLAEAYLDAIQPGDPAATEKE